jgi:hypothetical protein
MKVVNLGEAINDARMRSPEDALKDALAMVGAEDGGAFEKGKKVLIICLDTDDDQYVTNWLQAGMSMSECISLCEVAKTTFLTEMNYIKPE